MGAASSGLDPRVNTWVLAGAVRKMGRDRINTALHLRKEMLELITQSPPRLSPEAYMKRVQSDIRKATFGIGVAVKHVGGMEADARKLVSSPVERARVEA